MNAVDCCPEKSFGGDIQESSFPCCIIDTSVCDFEHSIENRCREMALLNLGDGDFPVVPPWERNQLVQPFLKGQAILCMVSELRDRSVKEEEQGQDEAGEFADENVDPTPLFRLSLSTAVTAVIGLRDLLRIRYLFPQAIQDEDASRLRRDLIDHLESALRIEPILRKIARKLYRRPDNDEFATIGQLSVFYSVMLLWHPDHTPPAEDRESTEAAVRENLEKCVKEAHKPVREAAEQIIHYKIYNCLYPDPSDDSSYRESSRYFQMLTMYWNLVAQALIDRTGHSCGYSPYPLSPLFENVRLRIETCRAGLNLLGLDELDARMDEIFSLLEAATSWDGDELDLMSEDLRQRIGDVNIWLEKTKLRIGCKRYEVTQEEESFLALVRKEIRQYDHEVQDAFQKVLLSVSKNPTEPTSVAPGNSNEANGRAAGTSILDRQKCDDGVHWWVNGVDKGVLCKKKAIKGTILKILFDQLGHGWIPHCTFHQAIEWSEEEYFGPSGESGRMQKQLRLIRRFLDLEITFRKEDGVRFAEGVVKSSNQSSGSLF